MISRVYPISSYFGILSIERAQIEDTTQIELGIWNVVFLGEE